VGSPFITPASTIAAVAGWFFRVLPHTVTTAYVARAGVLGGAGGALLLTCLVQFALGFADRLPVIWGIPTGLIPTAAISLIFYVYLWRARRTPPNASGP
jgi:DNA-binding transcriptional LysR family regulator